MSTHFLEGRLSDFVEAAEQILQQAPVSPANVALLVNLAAAQFELGLYRKCIKSCEAAADVAPTALQAYKIWGRALLAQNKQPEAVALWERVLHTASFASCDMLIAREIRELLLANSSPPPPPLAASASPAAPTVPSSQVDSVSAPPSSASANSEPELCDKPAPTSAALQSTTAAQAIAVSIISAAVENSTAETKLEDGAGALDRHEARSPPSSSSTSSSNVDKNAGVAGPSGSPSPAKLPVSERNEIILSLQRSGERQPIVTTPHDAVIKDFYRTMKRTGDAAVMRAPLISAMKANLPHLTHHPDLDNLTALAYLEINSTHYDRALEILNFVIHHWRSAVSAWIGRGSIYAMVRQLKNAVDDFSEAIKYDSSVAEAWKRRAQTRAAMNQYKDGLADLSKAICLAPRDAEVYYQRGLIYHQAHCYQKALQDYRDAERFGYSTAILLNLIGQTEGQLGNIEAAIQAHKKALELDHTLKEAYINLALMYKEYGDASNALESLERCLYYQTHPALGPSAGSQASSAGSAAIRSSPASPAIGSTSTSRGEGRGEDRMTLSASPSGPSSASSNSQGSAEEIDRKPLYFIYVHKAQILYRTGHIAKALTPIKIAINNLYLLHAAASKAAANPSAESSVPSLPASHSSLLVTTNHSSGHLLRSPAGYLSWIRHELIQALYRAACCYQSLGIFHKALVFYDQILKLNPHDVAFYNKEILLAQWEVLDEKIHTYNLDNIVLPAWKEGWCKSIPYNEYQSTHRADCENYQPKKRPSHIAVCAIEDDDPVQPTLLWEQSRAEPSSPSSAAAAVFQGQSESRPSEQRCSDTISPAGSGLEMDDQRLQSLADSDALFICDQQVQKMRAIQSTAFCTKAMQLQSPGFVYNRRQRRMFGLAALQALAAFKAHLDILGREGSGLLVLDDASSRDKTHNGSYDLRVPASGDGSSTSNGAGPTSSRRPRGGGSSGNASSSSGRGGSSGSAASTYHTVASSPLSPSSSSSSSSSSATALASVDGSSSSSSRATIPSGSRTSVLSCHRFGWRDMYDLIVRWRQVSEPNDAVFYIDRMPPAAFLDGYGLQTPIISGALHTVRYACYSGPALAVLKACLGCPSSLAVAALESKPRHYCNIDERRKIVSQEQLQRLEKAETPIEVLESIGEGFYITMPVETVRGSLPRVMQSIARVVRSQRPSKATDGFPSIFAATSTDSERNDDPVAHGQANSSSSSSPRLLEGTRITLLKPASGEGVEFTIRTAGTPARYAAFSAEMDYVFEVIEDLFLDIRRQSPAGNDCDRDREKERKDDELVLVPITELSDESLQVLVAALAMYYVWIVFSPLSRGTAICGLAAMQAILLAHGKVMLSHIQPGKQLDWEAILSSNVAEFIEKALAIVHIARISKHHLQRLAANEKLVFDERTGCYSVALETFSTMKDMIHALALPYTEDPRDRM